MEKKIIIDFLNKHWDEFTALLSGSTAVTTLRICTGSIPDDIYEFASLLSKMITIRQMHATDKQKGLLEKAQQFLKTDSVNTHESNAIIMQNGLFVVQPPQHSEILDMSFKNLVDSVL